MNRSPLLPVWAGVPAPFIGVVHLRPLPGSPKYAGPLAGVREAALADATTLAKGGAHGILIENYGDAPYFPRRVPAYVLTTMAVIAAEVRRAVGLPVGVNVLRNDGLGAMAVAAAAELSFIRVNVLCGTFVADQGLLPAIAHRLLRMRARLGVRVAIWADVRVKHAAPLVPRDLAVEAQELVERGGADALIVTGAATGRPVIVDDLETVAKAVPATPVLVGSGARAENVAELLPLAAGFIVGSALKPDGRLDAPISLEHVRRFAAALDR